MTDNSRSDLQQAVISARGALSTAEKALDKAFNLHENNSNNFEKTLDNIDHAQILVGKCYGVLRAAELALLERAS